MSRLLLVRHGQARSFEKHADRLTPLGEAQSHAVAAWLAAQGSRFDEIQCGTLGRQVETARLAAPGQALLEDARWNEYDAVGLMEVLAPKLAESNVAFSEKLAIAREHRGRPDANRYFQPMFEMLLNCWIDGGIADPGVEPWTAFLDRVGAVLDQTLSGGKRDVLVVTSGGVIGAVVQKVVQAPSRMALELNWRMRNASLTEFLFTKGRISLDSFNATPHLTTEQISYR